MMNKCDLRWQRMKRRAVVMGDGRNEHTSQERRASRLSYLARASLDGRVRKELLTDDVKGRRRNKHR